MAVILLVILEGGIHNSLTKYYFVRLSVVDLLAGLSGLRLLLLLLLLMLELGQTVSMRLVVRHHAGRSGLDLDIHGLFLDALKFAKDI